MKITKIEDITDALLKEVTASSVTEFIAEEIKKVSDQFVAEKNEKETALKAATEKSEAALAEQENLKKQLEEVNQKLSAIQAEQEAKAKEETFNMRMASLDNEYDLENEDRSIIAKQIKDLTEESFEEYKSSLAVLMKEKNKGYKKAMKEKMDKEKEAKAQISEEAVASETEKVAEKATDEVVNQAVDNGTKASAEIPNSAPAAEPTIQEKYAKAFSLDGFEIK